MRHDSANLLIQENLSGVNSAIWINFSTFYFSKDQEPEQVL